MLGFVSGKVVSLEEGSAVVENNGLGFELAVSSNTLGRLEAGAETKLYTYLQVREDGLTLFGFATLDEKKMFLKLVSVLSGLKLSDLAAAIVTENVTALTSIKGLGKKTAERIILELKEKVSVTPDMSDGALTGKDGFTSPESNEAVSVLVSLGLNRQEAASRVKNAAENGASTTEELLSYALKNS